MIVLALDTCLEACSVGVSLDAAGAPVVASAVIGRGHAERLMPMLADVLGRAGIRAAEIGRIGVTVGPGSFTGVRIGIAAARGLALVTRAETVSLGTLAALAARARALAGPRPVLAALDARRGEVYAQFFGADGLPRTGPEVGAAAAFAARLAGADALAGSGAAAIAAAAPAPVAILHEERYPDIATLLAMARAAPPDAARPRPLYLRPPDARPQDHAGVARL
ncbi:MAG TPA: tRNA (adenosine(37)-N6)-threonylcarbamoyltransferase complex dimerization subunit type 1 TsaB [Bauldia sp.]|nr:tRNA (adenosine(37)-N6)-threonylcarbamoyltransferase complex dimerization subunit type 1 TsaB [Bauldia sp.]